MPKNNSEVEQLFLDVRRSPSEAREQYLERISPLIEQTKDFSIKNQKGRTLIMEAVEQRNIDLFYLLYEKIKYDSEFTQHLNESDHEGQYVLSLSYRALLYQQKKLERLINEVIDAYDKSSEDPDHIKISDKMKTFFEKWKNERRLGAPAEVVVELFEQKKQQNEFQLNEIFQVIQSVKLPLDRFELFQRSYYSWPEYLIFKTLSHLTKKQDGKFILNPNLGQKWLIEQFHHYLYLQGKNPQTIHDKTLINSIKEQNDPGLCLGFATIFCLEEQACLEAFYDKLIECSLWDRKAISLEDDHAKPNQLADTFERIITLIRLAQTPDLLFSDEGYYTQLKHHSLQSYYQTPIRTPFSSFIENNEYAVEKLLSTLQDGQKIRISDLQHTVALQKISSDSFIFYDSNASVGRITLNKKEVFERLQLALFLFLRSERRKHELYQKAIRDFFYFQLSDQYVIKDNEEEKKESREDEITLHIAEAKSFLRVEIILFATDESFKELLQQYKNQFNELISEEKALLNNLHQSTWLKQMIIFDALLASDLLEDELKEKLNIGLEKMEPVVKGRLLQRLLCNAIYINDPLGLKILLELSKAHLQEKMIPLTIQNPCVRDLYAQPYRCSLRELAAYYGDCTIMEIIEKYPDITCSKKDEKPIFYAAIQSHGAMLNYLCKKIVSLENKKEILLEQLTTEFFNQSALQEEKKLAGLEKYSEQLLTETFKYFLDQIEKNDFLEKKEISLFLFTLKKFQIIKHLEKQEKNALVTILQTLISTLISKEKSKIFNNTLQLSSTNRKLFMKFLFDEKLLTFENSRNFLIQKVTQLLACTENQIITELLKKMSISEPSSPLLSHLITYVLKNLYDPQNLSGQIRLAEEQLMKEFANSKKTEEKKLGLNPLRRVTTFKKFDPINSDSDSDLDDLNFRKKAVLASEGLKKVKTFRNLSQMPFFDHDSDEQKTSDQETNVQELTSKQIILQKSILQLKEMLEIGSEIPPTQEGAFSLNRKNILS